MNSPENPIREHPTTFGVYRPVGHVLLSFPGQALADQAATALLASGFSPQDLVRYTAAQMVAQAEFDIGNATALASLGQDLNLVKAQLAWAQQGQAFVAVRANDDELPKVVAVAKTCQASRAQRYGLLVVEEMLPVGTDEHQIAESPDRGLDAQTPADGNSDSQRPGR